VTTAPSGPTGAARRTPWSRGAAACALALSGLEAGLLARGDAPQAYLVVVLLVSATVGGLAGVGVALRNCVVSRVGAVTVAMGTLAAVALLTTVGTPGSADPEPLGGTAAVAVVLGLAVLALVAADAARRSVRRSVRSA
jgi:hypothetical protein